MPAKSAPYLLAYCDGLLEALDDEFALHPRLGQFVTLTFRSSATELAGVFFRWNWITREYVIATKQMLARSSRLLLDSAYADDKSWGARIHGYLEEETYVAKDGAERIGHEEWNTEDLERGKAGDPAIAAIIADLTSASRPDFISDYVTFFVDHADAHPYACLGAKRLLEGVTVTIGPAFLRGLRQAPSAALTSESLGFVAKHIEADGGDAGHLSLGDRLLDTIRDPGQLAQVQGGMRAASRMYRRLIAWL